MKCHSIANNLYHMWLLMTTRAVHEVFHHTLLRRAVILRIFLETSAYRSQRGYHRFCAFQYFFVCFTNFACILTRAFVYSRVPILYVYKKMISSQYHVYLTFL